MEEDDKAAQHAGDLALVRAVLEGDAAAAAEIEARYRGMLIRILVARGVPANGAEEVVADLISECFGARKSGEIGKARLESYRGQAALSTWLVRAAWNKWLDLRRRDKFHGELPRQADRESVGDAFDSVPSTVEANRLEPDLTRILRAAISTGFASVDPDVMLMMKLIYLHRSNQQAVARMWGWNQSKVSRAMAAARDQIEAKTLAEIRRLDPDLVVEWEDFRELCQLSPATIF